MNIWVLGGSNAGMRDGWAAQLQTRAAPGAIDNRFLGAVGSLYGLMRLMKAERDGEALPDAIVFEFYLNDILLFEASVLRAPIVADALEQLANLCARRNIRLLMLCLEPRPDPRASLAKAKVRARKLYSKAAARHDLSPCVWPEEIFSEPITPALYQDENHYTREASMRIADHVVEKLAAGAARTPKGSDAESPFDYVDARQARRRGPCELTDVTSKVFSGPFLSLARGGWSAWPGKGRLAALMLQSTDKSGVYLIKAEGALLRKNARSFMQEVVRNLMLLHYVTRNVDVVGQVEISMPRDERELMATPEDGTLLAVAPIAPFDEQTLDIHGVIFWSPRGLTRLFLALWR